MGLGIRGRRAREALVVVAPAIVLVLVLALDVANGTEPVLGLVVIAPLLAANVVGPWPTAAYAAAALGAGAWLGVLDGQYVEDLRPTQLTRLALIALGGALAIAASVVRIRRERRLTAVQRIADVVQRAVLPAVPARIGSVSLVARYDSAAGEASVGGDLYAAVESPFGVRLLVGDVRGKGLEAVQIASVVLGAFRERAPEREDLARLADDLDGAVARAAGPEDFVTAVLAQIDEAGAVELLNAGHPPPVLVRDGTALPLEPTVSRLPLGLDLRPAHVPADAGRSAVRLTSGDRLLLYTDGLTEARHRRDGSFLAVETVAGTLGAGTLAGGVDALHATLLQWVGGRLHDDVALLAAESHHAPSDPHDPDDPDDHDGSRVPARTGRAG